MRQQERRFRRQAVKIRDANNRFRRHILLLAADARACRRIGAMLPCSLWTVSLTPKRDVDAHEAGLVVRRDENADPNVGDPSM